MGEMHEADGGGWRGLAARGGGPATGDGFSEEWMNGCIMVGSICKDIWGMSW